MAAITYLQRRSELQTYFDRTAVDAWARLTSDAPVGRIRATVRAGRDEMRNTLLSWLPARMDGARLLDAGCGTGALAIEAARRGAEVVAIDLSPTLVSVARTRLPDDIDPASIDFRSGDMLDPALGRFDYVVAMDSLIHYRAPDICRIMAGLAARTTQAMLVTFAPKTPALTLMHAVGRLFPRGDRAPAIEPVAEHALLHRLECTQGLEQWQAADSHRVTSGFLQIASVEDDTPMKQLSSAMAKAWMRLGTRFLPFADAATKELPLGRLMRLSLFQVSVGMSIVLLNGTLNRVMIVELGVSTILVSAMVSLPLVFAPFRVLIGFRSDNHRSVLGWRRVPYIWMGTMLQFGGLAIMPFALLLLSGTGESPAVYGQIGAALAFLMIGAGLHTTQTAGLALATDIAPEDARPRVVAFLYVMLLIGMAGSAFVYSELLRSFSEMRLIQVIQGAAVLQMLFNIAALWKQEARNPALTSPKRVRPEFQQSWAHFRKSGGSVRVLAAVALGTAGFSMQDILLEPYGAEVLHLSVGQTTALTAFFALGTLAGFGLAARALGRGVDAYRLAGFGAVAGIFAFTAVIFAAPLNSILLFRVGTALIGFGGGLFAAGTLTAAMAIAKDGQSGLALGTWGAVQATAAGGGILLGGVIRDAVMSLGANGLLGRAFTEASSGYSVVYHLEIALLFATLVAIGPLVRSVRTFSAQPSTKFGLAEFPG